MQWQSNGPEDEEDETKDFPNEEIDYDNLGYDYYEYENEF